MKKIEKNLISLEIFVEEEEKTRDKIHAHKAIIDYLMEIGIDGFTVYKGIAGYGKKKQFHTVSLLELSEDLPIIIRVLETEENINKILNLLEELKINCVVELHDAKFIRFSNE